MGDASLQVIHENRGAAIRSIDYLQNLLELNTPPQTFHADYIVNTRNFNEAGGGGLKHSDAVVQYLFQVAHGPESTFLRLGFAGLLETAFLPV
jgi:hypothetical protein